MTHRVIVLYDAECILCSRLVRFIIRRDKRRVIRFAPLSASPIARALTSRFAVDHPHKLPDSLVVIDGGRLYTHSTAALRVARTLQGGWRLAYVFILVPRPIRDAIYRLVARKRYTLFGRASSCPLPDAELRSRLLSDQEVSDTITTAS